MTEVLVTDKLEQKLQEIEEIKFIEFTSRLRTSSIVIKLQDIVKNHEEVWSRVRDRLADITPQMFQSNESHLRPQHVQGFYLLPKRWVVERTFGWFNWWRRLSNWTVKSSSWDGID